MYCDLPRRWKALFHEMHGVITGVWQCDYWRVEYGNVTTGENILK